MKSVSKLSWMKSRRMAIVYHLSSTNYMNHRRRRGWLKDAARCNQTVMEASFFRGEIQCIGATTLDEFRKHIEKDPALERRFQKIIVATSQAIEDSDRHSPTALKANMKNTISTLIPILLINSSCDPSIRSICLRPLSCQTKRSIILDEAGWSSHFDDEPAIASCHIRDRN